MTTDTKGYVIGPVIGSGAYGVVVRATLPGDPKDYAIKFFGYSDVAPDIQYILREIDILSLLKSVPGVVTLKGTFNDCPAGVYIEGHSKHISQFCPAIITENLSGGTLFSRIIKKSSTNAFTEFHAATVFKSFIETLKEIHSCNVINCDIKLDNIMLAREGDLAVKIIDFGVAVNLADRDIFYHYGSAKGTPAFMAPETIENRSDRLFIYSRQTDLWQAACVLYCLLTGCFPFGKLECGNSNLEELYCNIEDVSFEVMPDDLCNVSEESKDLLNKMFRKNPSERLSIGDILRHPWLSGSAALNAYCFGPNYHVLMQNLRNNNFLQHQHRTKELLFGVLCPSSPRSGSTSGKGSPASYVDSGKDGAQLAKFQSVLEAIQNRPRARITPHCLVKLRDKFIQCSLQQATCDADEDEDKDENEDDDEDVDSKTYVDPETKNLISQYQRLFNYKGFDHQKFGALVSDLKLDQLNNIEVFQILDWDKSGTIDYLECMISLSILLLDEDASKLDAIADVYFDVFSIHNNNGRLRTEVVSMCINELLKHLYSGLMHVPDDTKGGEKRYITKEEFRTLFKQLFRNCEEINNLVATISRTNSLTCGRSRSGSRSAAAAVPGDLVNQHSSETDCDDSRTDPNSTTGDRPSLVRENSYFALDEDSVLSSNTAAAQFLGQSTTARESDDASGSGCHYDTGLHLDQVAIDALQETDSC